MCTPFLGRMVVQKAPPLGGVGGGAQETSFTPGQLSLLQILPSPVVLLDTVHFLLCVAFSAQHPPSSPRGRIIPEWQASMTM